MDVEKQVISIFALTNGLLDDVKLPDILRFENELHAFFARDKEGIKIFDEIKDTKGLPNPKIIEEVILRFKKVFV